MPDLLSRAEAWIGCAIVIHWRRHTSADQPVPENEPSCERLGSGHEGREVPMSSAFGEGVGSSLLAPLRTWCRWCGYFFAVTGIRDDGKILCPNCGALNG